jgi:hypothetical protein
MILPTDTDTPQAIATLRHALASEHIALSNLKYRLGDTVALLAIRAWVEARYGAGDTAHHHRSQKTWYLRADAPALKLLRHYLPDPVGEAPDGRSSLADFLSISSAPDNHGTLDDTDVGFWYFNDLFHHEGFRLNFTPRRRPDGRSVRLPYRVIFAPLVEADYSCTRTLAMPFVVELANALAERFPHQVCVIAPPAMSSIDREIFATRVRADVRQAPLADVIDAIAATPMFIGCDTGLSHVAACFPDVRQIALYGAENARYHADRDRGSTRRLGEVLHAITGHRATYNAYPLKADCTVIEFEHHGMDGVTLERVMEEVGRED